MLPVRALEATLATGLSEKGRPSVSRGLSVSTGNGLSAHLDGMGQHLVKTAIFALAYAVRVTFAPGHPLVQTKFPVGGQIDFARPGPLHLHQ